MTPPDLPEAGREPSIPVAQTRAAVALLSPDEITPTAKRVLLSICDQHDPEDEPDEPATSCEDLCMDECIGACGVFIG